MWGLGWDMQICGCSRAGDVKGARVCVCDCISVPLCSWEIAVNSNAFSLHFLDFARAIKSIRLWINFHISTKHGSNPTLWVQISQQHPLNQRKRRKKNLPLQLRAHHFIAVCCSWSNPLWFCPCVLNKCWPAPFFLCVLPRAGHPLCPPPPPTSKRPQTRGVQVMGRWTGGHPM